MIKLIVFFSIFSSIQPEQEFDETSEIEAFIFEDEEEEEEE